MEQFPDDDTSNAADIDESPHFAGGTEVRPHRWVVCMEHVLKLKSD